MTGTYIIGNWKSHMTRETAAEWFETFARQYVPEDGKTVILCPPLLLVPFARKQIEKFGLQMSLGVQDMTPFADGAHTGEEPAELVKEYASYALIGHSERRREFGETNELVANKVAQAVKHDIMPVVCVQNGAVPVPEGAKLIAYEPLFAIGSGTPDTPENADGVAKKLSESYNNAAIIYGGSVTDKNVRSFTERTYLKGVLPGGASLNPVTFAGIIRNA